MKKIRLFFNFEKEEEWLKHMAEQGYQLKSVRFAYTFCVAEPEQSIIKIDYRVFKNNRDYLDYCALFEDSGWQHIAGTRQSGTQYFKKVKSNGNEDIFSDSSSRAGRYKRLSDMWLSLTAAFFPLLIVGMSSDRNITDGLLNPKTLYFTPGLWEMNGFNFWRHFLFETPFALVRGYLTFVWPLFVLLYIIFAIKSWRLYKKTLTTDHR